MGDVRHVSCKQYSGTPPSMFSHSDINNVTAFRLGMSVEKIEMRTASSEPFHLRLRPLFGNLPNPTHRE